MPSILNQDKIRIAIDRGGTFCDFFARIPGRKEDVIFKLLSVAPDEYSDAPTEGIRKILEIASGRSIPREEPLDLEPVESIRMGTTVATNALLERKGERVALLITKGFRDLLIIGNQARPHLFDLSVRKLDKLYDKVVEIDERITIQTSTAVPDGLELVEGSTGEVFHVLKKPDYDNVRQVLQKLWEEGFRSIAIALVHSYAFSEHEVQIGNIAREFGFQVSVSSELQPSAKVVSRAHSAVVDAYISPITQNYINNFRMRFKGHLEDENANKLLLSRSDGGLTSWRKFTGLSAILSGPAGGVVGYAKTCYDPKDGTPVLGFDMGGTSTDVSRYGGALEHVFESTTAEVTIQAPQLDINTVAAGGGSMLFWRNGMFVVGPESAGASPGPACYGKGGPLTITDCNYFLGRILPDFFPQPLDLTVVRRKFKELTVQVNAEKEEGLPPLSSEEVAMGFLQVANAAMTRPIRTLSEGRGFETSRHNLACFGGAGGQHATAVARDLGIRRVLIHRLSSILSAYGMALADVVVEAQEAEAVTFNSESLPRLMERFEQLRQKVTDNLLDQGFGPAAIDHECYLNMRYQGSDTALMIAKPERWEDYADAFVTRHQREFGFTQPRDILVDDIRVRGVGKGLDVEVSSPFEQLKTLQSTTSNGNVKPSQRRKVYFEETGWIESNIYHLDKLPVGFKVAGPAMIIDQTQTLVLDPASEATILLEHVVIEIKDTNTRPIDTVAVDPIKLAVFGHRFMSIAEQMGRTLQKTSISVNIKERLDYSCAIFSSDGSLVSNAPHIPGHLGSMSYAIAYQARRYKKGELRPGHVILANHPVAGGTHLPDLTVITPVFDEQDSSKILFFVANRGHHADIGGIAAGSMPPNSTELWQEGAAIESFLMVKDDVFDEAGVTEELYIKPGQYPGCSGTRTLQDNIADLKASVASNHRGISLINGLVREYGWPVVEFYMNAIRKNAEDSVRTLLISFSERFKGQDLSAVDYLDDGTPLALSIKIDPNTGSARFDFTGTGPEALNNLNTPPAIMYSGIMYCLRSMISADIPLNQGCLAPIDIYCPPGTILSPSLKAATVGSNVESSQRIVDLIFKAFRACAASQGTCNNLTFGCGGKEVDAEGKERIVKGFGYYETIAGGAGAGADWDGQSGVHTHITNTRMTDPETFERRYPVLLREFSIRHGSGGRGLHRGGDGCIRDIEFRKDSPPLQVSILSQRRVIPPYGMAGGEDGERGLNLWIRKDPVDGTTRTINMGGMATAQMNPGDRIIIKTPGGGGYGVDPEKKSEVSEGWAFKLGPNERYGAGQARANGSISQREIDATTN